MILIMVFSRDIYCEEFRYRAVAGSFKLYKAKMLQRDFISK